MEQSQAALVLTSMKSLRMFSPFLPGECSAGQAAERLGVHISTVTYWIRRFLALGLIQQTRLEERAGRAVRYYRAVAEEFLIPLHIIPTASLADLHERVHESLRENMTRHQMAALQDVSSTAVVSIYTQRGVLFLDYVDADSRLPVFSASADGTATLEQWESLRLTHEDAKALQRELMELVARYRQREGPRTYLLNLRLAQTRQG